MRLRGKARDWNWHNVVGFWAFVPLSVIVLTGTVIGFPWASDLVYRLAGDTPPPRKAAASPATQKATTSKPADRPAVNLAGLNTAWAAAAADSPAWTQLTMRLVPGRGEADNDPAGRIGFTAVHGSELNPADRTTLTVDRRTGRVVGRQAYADQSPGRQLRVMVVPVHRGESFGLTGMTIAAGGCVSALVLVYTGFTLSYRRLVRPAVRRCAHALSPRPAYGRLPRTNRFIRVG